MSTFFYSGSSDGWEGENVINELEIVQTTRRGWKVEHWSMEYTDLNFVTDYAGAYYNTTWNKISRAVNDATH